MSINPIDLPGRSVLVMTLPKARLTFGDMSRVLITIALAIAYRAPCLTASAPQGTSVVRVARHGAADVR